LKAVRFGSTPWLALLVASLCVYGALRHPWISYRECRRDPARCEGRVIEGFREAMIGPVSADGFTLLQRGDEPVFVHADTAGLKSGEYVSLKAVLLADGSLRAVRAVMAERRREKMALSLVPAVFGVVLFMVRFRFDFRSRMFKRRRRA
jgi:hypothetical protein